MTNTTFQKFPQCSLCKSLKKRKTIIAHRELVVLMDSNRGTYDYRCGGCYFVPGVATTMAELVHVDSNDLAELIAGELFPQEQYYKLKSFADKIRDVSLIINKYVTQVRSKDEEIEND